MNKEIERLWANRDMIKNQIKNLDKEIDAVDKQIEIIQNKCSHVKLKISKEEKLIVGRKYTMIIKECEECGAMDYDYEEWLD